MFASTGTGQAPNPASLVLALGVHKKGFPFNRCYITVFTECYLYVEKPNTTFHSDHGYRSMCLDFVVHT